MFKRSTCRDNKVLSRAPRTCSRWPLAPLALVALVVGCNVLPEATPTPTLAKAYVLDDTGSADAERCAELAADLASTLAKPGRRRLDLVVLAVGGSASGNEPRVIVPHRRFAALESAFEKAGAEETHRDAWMRDVALACRARMASPDRSPVFRALERAVTTLAAVCASVERDGGVCAAKEIAVFSDLRENVHPAIAARLRRTGGAGKRAALPTPIPRLDFAGITVTACGISATRTAKRDAFDPDAIVATWQEILGPGVAIAAGCPRLDVATGKGAADAAP